MLQKKLEQSFQWGIPCGSFTTRIKTIYRHVKTQNWDDLKRGKTIILSY